MANTYTKILIQYVFAVKHREALITEEIREEVQKYISGIIVGHKHKMLAIYCMPDHCHLLVGLNTQQSLSDLARDVKAGSAKWINERRFFPRDFNWQEGYGAFSYGKSQLDSVVHYILNQKEHHQGKSFKQEYYQSLQKFNVEYNEKYLFQWLEE